MNQEDRRINDMKRVIILPIRIPIKPGTRLMKKNTVSPKIRSATIRKSKLKREKKRSLLGQKMNIFHCISASSPVIRRSPYKGYRGYVF